MKFLREPLLHFLVIGAALFGVFQLRRMWATTPTSDEIVVSAGQIASIAAIFASTWQRPPTAKELDALVNEHVRDEVLYRQASRWASTRTTPSSAAACGRRWSSSPT